MTILVDRLRNRDYMLVADVHIDRTGVTFRSVEVYPSGDHYAVKAPEIGTPWGRTGAYVIPRAWRPFVRSAVLARARAVGLPVLEQLAQRSDELDPRPVDDGGQA